MKRFIYILLAAMALLAGLCACRQKIEEPMKSVDLRYKAQDSYELAATGAKAITIQVVSTDPWTVTSEHPDWCIISEEEGDASDFDLVHTGKAEATVITIHYYDNKQLDDRIDKITIQSDYWVGKVITVRQAGSAFLTVAANELNQEVDKNGGDYAIHVKSNQDWSARVTDGDWISVTEGATGSGKGTITVHAENNAKEMRYATLTVFNRLNEAAAVINFTQDGVQLVPSVTEIRAAYDQTSCEVDVTSNTEWVAVKNNEVDDWFEILTPSGNKDGKIQISMTKNDGTRLRSGVILLRNVVASEGDFVAEKFITLKQAYLVTPVVHIFDNDEAGNWNPQSAVLPSFVAGKGMLFANGCTLQNGSMPFGDYTFYWRDIVAVNSGVRIRAVFAYSDIEEMKFGLRINSSGKNVMYLDFNAASSGKSGKPEGYSVPENVDFSVPHTFGLRFLPIIGSEYCHVGIYLDGALILEFDTSEKILDEVKWGTKINMYLSVDSGGAGDSAILEKYEYSAPLDWGD